MGRIEGGSRGGGEEESQLGLSAPPQGRQRQPYGHGGNILLTLCLDTFNLLKLYVNVHLML